MDLDRTPETKPTSGGSERRRLLLSQRDGIATEEKHGAVVRPVPQGPCNPEGRAIFTWDQKVANAVHFPLWQYLC